METNPLLNLITQVLTPPTEADIACQAPKPIILQQSAFKPYPWSPEVLPASILRIGQFALLAVPGEFTVMSGRRLRETVRGVLGNDQLLVVAGLSNAYPATSPLPRSTTSSTTRAASPTSGAGPWPPTSRCSTTWRWPCAISRP